MKRMLQLTALAIALAAAGQAVLASPIPPNYCGDPCSPNGASAGCRCDDGTGIYRRDICYCINGRWTNHF